MSRFSNLRRLPLLREPLVHFLLFGALLFGAITLASQARQPVVTIDAQDIEQLAKYWELQNHRAPTRAELAALINERVDEELLAREAIRLGLDKEDMIVRRRLAQKMAFTSEDVAAIPEPDDRTLQAYFEQHREGYAIASRVAVQHVFFSRDRLGEPPQAASTLALRRLNAGQTVPGDPSLLPLAYADITTADLARDYGEEFAEAVDKAPLGQWVGPVMSAFGVHLIRVERRMPSEIPPFADVRLQVKAAWLAERREDENRKFRLALRKRYKVEIAGLPQ